MEQSQTYLAEAEAADPRRARLLDAAKAMVLAGDKEFSIADLCSAAGVERNVFHDHFAGKTALMAALLRDCRAGAVAVAVRPDTPVSKADTTPEPSVSTPDEWFERRLRVFERALTALEARAETTAREQARTIAELQARLAGVPPSEPVAQAPACETVQMDPALVIYDAMQAEMAALNHVPDHVADQVPVADELPAADVPQSAEALVEPAAHGAPQVKPEIAAMPGPSDLRQGFRDNPIPDFEASAEPKRPKVDMRTRLMAIAAGLLVTAFVGAGFLLGRDMLDTNAEARTPDGVAHRQEASTTLHKTIALADAGDTRAQARLALAYLRGQGSAADADAALLWCMSAAKAGNPVAQYLLGALYQQGDHVPADPAQAVTWFSRAAEKGNLKAMHNLAIALAQGAGTPKDEIKAAEWFTRAAERGYVDSAFDLGVLYERGEGVPQDLKQALKWYGIAAFAGDQPSKERVEFLKGQMKAADIQLATRAAMAFSPLPALEAANNL
ncbi:MAG TPA: tetratricopeptide repeat protein [Rhizomicrobium sp.]|nr:tetratricopeptide repeat protein [Rhizomicrobium sp.]